jgi:hypothetical protein
MMEKPHCHVQAVGPASKSNAAGPLLFERRILVPG